MKKITGLILFLGLFGMAIVTAQETNDFCPMHEPEAQQKLIMGQPSFAGDGLHLTANGELNILVVFVRFPGDALNLQDGGGTWWAANDDPTVLNTIIDTNTSVSSTELYNLTHFFKEMSRSDFEVVGDAISVVAPQTAAGYGYNLGSASKDVIDYISDNNIVNFSDYDNWTANGTANHTQSPDGLVDMIVMVWKGSNFVASDWGGCASMYAGPCGNSETNPGTLSVNGGKEVKFGYGLNAGSGVTAFAPSDVRVMFNHVKHEIAHWLLGSGHPYPLYSTTPSNRVASLLSGAFNRSMTVNASERERLGWDVVPEITTGLNNRELRDFLTTGDAYKYKVPDGGTNEYYYFENHQKQSVYDDATNDNTDKGIFILHTNSAISNTSNIRYITSDGDWEWANMPPYTISGACCGTVPLFGKLAADPDNGENYMTQMYADNYDFAWHWPHGYKDENGNEALGGYYRGVEGFELKASYNISHRPLFAPITNPKPQTWSGTDNEFTFQIVNQIGNSLYLDFFTGYDPYDIKENTTWDGQIFLDDNVTVQSGKTLTIKPNTTVYVANNKSINVNGILKAEGVTFTAKDSNWGRINFYSGSKGSLTDVVIDKAKSYGGAAIYISNTDEYFLIKNSTIKNCAGACGGVYINNSSKVYIQNTHFENNTNDAITVSNYSNAYVFENFMDLSGTQTGVYTSGSSGVVLSAVTAPYYLGNNTISGGKFGIKAGYMSWLNAGTSSSFASQNRIANQSGSGWAHINTTSSSATINAKYDFWKPYNGNGGVAPTISGSGTINYSPYLTADPDPNVGFKQRFGNGDGEDAKLSQEYEALFQAIALGIEERYDEAEQILTHLIETSEAQDVIRQSLILYGQLARVSANTAAISFFEAKKGSFELTELNVAVKGILANLYSKRGESKEALTQLNEIIQDYPESEHAFNAVISAGYIAYDAGLTEKARQYYEQAVAMQQAQTTQEEKEIILNKLQFHFDAGSPVFKEGKTAEGNSNEQSDSGISMSNYPNPFNPTTNINFTLPQKSVVSLIVYDVLGREVATLVNGNLPAGKQTILFDASTLANGMYLYKLRVGNQEIVRKMTLIK